MSSLIKHWPPISFFSSALMFVYLLFKVGIIQCIGRSLCKMTWAAFKAYWFALRDMSCFLWHKLKNTKRVYRRRFRDVEAGYDSSEDDSYWEGYGSLSLARKRRSVRERRKDQMRRSLNPVRDGSKGRYRSHSHHHVRLKTSEVSVRLRDSGANRNSRGLRTRNAYKRRIRWYDHMLSMEKICW